ncbi:hypothetical protein QBC44DRAFT_311521 [Cladorrhinum sp. PSN332]|nr:hypothetical protein QBC44DRAFT_311521 [Cladorrhinum sp. PSN332]
MKQHLEEVLKIKNKEHTGAAFAITNHQNGERPNSGDEDEYFGDHFGDEIEGMAEEYDNDQEKHDELHESNFEPAALGPKEINNLANWPKQPDTTSARSMLAARAPKTSFSPVITRPPRSSVTMTSHIRVHVSLKPQGCQGSDDSSLIRFGTLPWNGMVSGVLRTSTQQIQGECPFGPVK